MSDVLDQKYEFKRVEELLERRVELNFRQNTETSNNATRVRLQFLSTHPRYGFTESCWTNEMVFPAISDLLVDGRLEQVRTPCFIVKIVAKAFKPRVHWLDSFESSELTSNPHIRYSHVLYSLIITLFIVLFILVPVLLVLKYESERRKARARDALFKFELEHGPSSTSQSYTKLQLNA
ncbi:hypothetical protein M3Y96_00816500 [Aphelenchoides besseyi]|nr:hypothetical protein M3Y96_00816500 [Aphelenchoides besseyi]